MTERAVGDRRRPRAGRRRREGAARGAEAAAGSRRRSCRRSQPSAAGTVISGFASAQARSRICSSSSAGWAPAAPYFRSTTKNGTPVAPRACAVAPSCRTAAQVAAVGQRLADLGLVEADLDGERHQRVDVEDRAALLEVGVQQPLLELVAQAVLGGEVQQLVGEQGVAADAVGQVVLQPLGGGELLDAASCWRASPRRCCRTWRPARAASGASRPRGRSGRAGRSARRPRPGRGAGTARGRSPTGACRCSTTDTRRRTRPLPACPAQLR